jgi:ribonucleoside-diphosphate reductase alpha chain
VSIDIWDRKYRWKSADGTPRDRTWRDTVRRVAKAAASVEPKGDRRRWAETYANAIGDFAFLPAGRILAGAGTGRRVTLFNCFVMGRIEDDLAAIFEQVKDAALTMQQGGGIGHDFSTLRPHGALVRSIGADASGPVTFMDVWDAMCRTIMSAGQRRGAMMATLRCDHPDIEAFVDAKRTPGRLRNFNLSVLVTDAFIAAVRADGPWNLVFEGKVYRTVRARDVWTKIMRATYDVAEPGVIFIDRVNALNNLAYCETIQATNPCGEQPLPPHGACLLGSINLAALVVDPFTPRARLDQARLDALIPIAVRFLDAVIDVSGYPLPTQRREAQQKRRIGLGVTGLADALIMLGLSYGSEQAQAEGGRWLKAIQEASYAASAALAAEKGAFPLCDIDALLARPGLARLPERTRAAVRAHGLRNGLLTSIAPTGTISLLAGNVSSGIEPVFDFLSDRRVLAPDGTASIVRVEDFADATARRLGVAVTGSAFVTAQTLAPADHLAMQAVAQAYVDSAISKTINCPIDLTFEAFQSIYLEAYDRGLKGVTTYRPNAVTGAVLSSAVPAAAAAAPPTSPALSPAPKQTPVVQPSKRDDGDVVYLASPLSRDPVLSGYTYKLKWPASDHALYITINDTAAGGRQRPFEIFINSKNLEHYAWTLALTRMISAIFRRGGDVSFVVEELKAVFDPRGGAWTEGHYVPSLLAAIGGIIETHLKRIGFMPADLEAAASKALATGSGSTTPDVSRHNLSPPATAQPATHKRAPAPLTRRELHAASFCPRCSAATYVRRDGCWTCETCGHSTCA